MNHVLSVGLCAKNDSKLVFPTQAPMPSVQPLTAFSELFEEALVTTDNGSKGETPKGINEGFCG